MNMMFNLGMPYMGSKRKLALKILAKMLEGTPKAKYFFDLFGGGGAMSFMAIQHRQFERVVYNELNTGVVELLRKIITGGVTSEFYQWIDRETFHKHKNDSDWFGGLCKGIWSFGNNQNTYLFGKDIEYNKKLAHKIVVNKSETALKELSKKLGVDIPKGIIENNNLFEKSIKERRREFRKFVVNNSIRFDLEQPEQLRQLQPLERLQHLERLQQLECLQQLEHLEIQNKSYENVVIDTPVNETIIYLDPPYKNTGKYQKDINHDDLLQWIKNSPYKNQIYVSSYEFKGLKVVAEYKHRCTLSATANNEVVERLYNGSTGE